MTRLSIAEITKVLIELSNGIPIEQLLQTYSIYRHKARFESGLVGPKKRDKRKCKLNANQLLTLKGHCLMNPFETNSMILHKLNLTISARTLGRYLKQLDLSNYICPRKFLISHVNRDDRRSYAMIRTRWTQEQFDKLVFTDESAIDNSGSHFRRVRRSRGARYSLDNVYHFQNETRRVNFFSCVTQRGVEKIVYYEIMNSEVYCETMHQLIRDLCVRFES